MPEIGSTSTEPEIKINPSNFGSHYFAAEIGELTYNFRVLKMSNSLFIYIGQNEKEIFDEIGVAMPFGIESNKCTGTTVLGPQLGCDSEELSVKLSKRLKKPIYLSCNIPSDRMIRPQIEKALSEEIKKHPDYF